MATPTLLAGPRDDGVDTWLASACAMGCCFQPVCVSTAWLKHSPD